MAKKKQISKSDFVLFNVVYEDGMVTSNRKVPASAVGGYDGEQPIWDAIEQQDREIAERSGKPRSPIKSITRAD